MREDDPLSDIPDGAFDRQITNYYDLLAVDRRSVQNEIQRAYRDLIQEYHPDLCDSPHSEEITYALNQAKEVLLDQNERVRYNDIGHDAYYTESLTTTNIVEKEDTHKDYDTSLFDLIKLAKLNDYTKEPWYKTLIKSTGFKIVTAVFLFLSSVFLVFLFI